MKIVQITVAAVDGYADVVYGLGDDGLPYIWETDQGWVRVS